MNAKQIAKGWNEFIDAMIYARECWEMHQKQILSISRKELENGLSYQARKVMSGTVHRASFDKALPDLVARWQVVGGLKELLVPIEKGTMKKTPKKETPDGKQRQLQKE